MPGEVGCGIAAARSCSRGIQLTSAIAKKESPMLVLSRKKNESIVINNDITIVVVEIRGDKVRLGVEAPKEVPVHRREVYDAIRRNDAAAAQARSESTSDSSSGAESPQS
jgi:carbon storage regulator